ncbi:MAG: transposase [Gammaproteobacteria bacterium]|nr:transposase [Gammaproteobacteria bacterium]
MFTSREYRYTSCGAATNREPCFFGEEDYSTYLHWLGEALKETSCSLHSYALMTNHVHLFLTPKNAATVPRLFVGTALRAVHQPRVPAYGHIVGPRYKSSLIQAETYLLTCMRYIELNPVRAAMVDDPAHSRWTSYRANALGQFSPLLSPHPVYLALGATDSARRVAYRTP